MALVNLNTRSRRSGQAAQHHPRRGARAAAGQGGARRDPDRLPIHWRAWLIQTMSVALRTQGRRRRDAESGQSRHLQRARPAGAVYAAGARMQTYWPLNIVQHGQALSVTALSYAGAMGFGFTTARSAIPDARELSAALLQRWENSWQAQVLRPQSTPHARRCRKRRSSPNQRPPASGRSSFSQRVISFSEELALACIIDGRRYGAIGDLLTCYRNPNPRGCSGRDRRNCT